MISAIAFVMNIGFVILFFGVIVFSISAAVRRFSRINSDLFNATEISMPISLIFIAVGGVFEFIVLILAAAYFLTFGLPK